MTSLNSQLFHLPELKVSIIFVEREHSPPEPFAPDLARHIGSVRKIS